MSSQSEVLAPAIPAERPIMRQLLALALPSIVSSVSVTLMQFTNSLMIAGLDKSVPPSEQLNLAASINGGMSAYVFIFAAMGVGTAVNTLASQSLGRGEKLDCGAYACQGLWVAIVSIFVFLPLTLLGPAIFTALHHDPRLIPVETRFFQIYASSAPIILASSVMSNFFLGIHRPVNQMIAGIAGNIVDGLLCYALLFGHFGLPKMGVCGAAVSAACGSLTSLLVMFGVFLTPSVRKIFGGYSSWKPSWSHMWHVMRLGIPAGIQQGSDLLTWAIFSVGIIGSMGTMYSAAQSTVMNCMFLSFMPAIGVGTAVNAMVGRKIGEKRFDLAHASAFAGMRLTLSYMGACGLVFFFFRHQLVSLFLSEPARAAVAAKLLVLAAIFQAFDALNVVFISALRGAGDVRQPTIVMMSLAWGVCVGGGMLVARTLPGLNAVGPWMMATAYIMLVATYVSLRWRSEAWKKVDVFAGKTEPAI